MLGKKVVLTEHTHESVVRLKLFNGATPSIFFRFRI